MGKLNGKNVIVTGASRGIGREIAKLFASEGGNIICAARTLNEGDHQFEGSLNSTVSEIKSSGRPLEPKYFSEKELELFVFSDKFVFVVSKLPLEIFSNTSP